MEGPVKLYTDQTYSGSTAAEQLSSSKKIKHLSSSEQIKLISTAWLQASEPSCKQHFFSNSIEILEHSSRHSIQVAFWFQHRYVTKYVVSLVRFCFESKDYGMAWWNDTIPSVAPTYEDFETLSSMTCLVSPLGVVQSTGHITKTVAYDKRCCNNLPSFRKAFHNTMGPFCSKYIDTMWCCLSGRLHLIAKFCVKKSDINMK